MSTANTWHIIGATFIGVIGAATILIIEHFRQERRRHVLSQDVARMSRQLSMMRNELDQLRDLQQKRDKKLKRNKKRNSFLSTTTTSTEDYGSVLDAESSDQEFYDLSDEEIPLTTIEKSFERTLGEIERNLDNGNADVIQETLVVIQNLLEEQGENADLLWRMAKAYYQLAMVTSDVSQKQDHIQKGIETCTRALKLNPNDPSTHKWYAILIGSRADFQSMKDKISDGHLFKQHIDIAIKLSPKDPSLHHLLGRFAYEVAGLKWYERKAAAALFGEPPAATYQEALNHFLTAEKLTDKEWKENRMLIAKCFIANGEYKDALDWLRKAKNIISKDEIERRFDEEIQTLILKYNHYS